MMRFWSLSSRARGFGNPRRLQELGFNVDPPFERRLYTEGL